MYDAPRPLPPSGLRERVNGPFFCRENLKWNFFTRECVKQDTCVNMKLGIFVREFVNLDLGLNVKHGDITISIFYKFAQFI